MESNVEKEYWCKNLVVSDIHYNCKFFKMTFDIDKFNLTLDKYLNYWEFFVRDYINYINYILNSKTDTINNEQIKQCNKKKKRTEQ